MLSLFNGRLFSSESAPASAEFPAIPCDAPTLLVELTPRHRVFVSNLLDILLFRRPAPLPLTSSPSDFWPDVFVNRKLPFQPFCQSGLSHFFVIAAVYGLSQLAFLHPPKVVAQSAFNHATITYYKVSEYLPPIRAAEPAPAKLPLKGDPAYARQKIISIRPNSVSRNQTIIAPPAINLPQDVSVPNIVAWKPVPAPPPDALVVHSGTQLPFATEVIPPAPAVDAAKLRIPPDILARSIVPPPPTIANTGASQSILPLPSAVEPVVSATNLHARLGDLNVANTAVVQPSPKLPLAEQRSSGSLARAENSTIVPPPPSARGLASTHAAVIPSSSDGTRGVVPPPPSTHQLHDGEHAAGGLIALGIHPVSVSGPVSAPPGNRSGTFAAGPEGRPGAAGTPEIKGGGAHNGAGGNGVSPNAAGQPTAGIVVEPGPSLPSGGEVVSKPARTNPAKTTLLASLTRPSLADLARATRTQSPTPSAPSTAIEREVFGEKRFYSMVLNMPNLNSRGGSWIVRFAELKASPDQGAISAPVAVRKVDPAYPSELMRDRVEGTVVLYAVIHSDGTVSDVRVLHGIDSRLDQNACRALAKWHFRPGTKSGTAVDLEAVVQIPFLARPAF